jgi:hypothetical protein
MIFALSVVFSFFFTAVTGRSVLELQGVNFELALTSYKYAAILFYDSSPPGQLLVDQWLKAAQGFGDNDDIHGDGEIAMVTTDSSC